LLARTAEGQDPSDATVAVMEQQRHWLEPLTPEEQAISHRAEASEAHGPAISDAIADAIGAAISAAFSAALPTQDCP
jgi:predicted kinase